MFTTNSYRMTCIFPTEDNNNNIKFKTSMIRSSLCVYNDTYILVKEL